MHKEMSLSNLKDFHKDYIILLTTFVVKENGCQMERLQNLGEKPSFLN